MATLTINGQRREVALDAQRSLLAVLREELGLTAAKYGCGEGQCGACTVWLDGEAVQACSIPITDAIGRSVVTLEGLGSDGELGAVQRGFAEVGAMQCGFCTPGMIMGAAALLAKRADPDEAAIRAALQGHVCRCGTYPRIVRAVLRAAELLRQGMGKPEQALAGNPVRDLPPRDVPWDLQPAKKRRFFEILGDGWVMVVPPSPPVDGLPKGGAWVHVGANGAVSAFAGKVEIGQGIRTGFALLVAEELGVPLGQVRVRLGDTDICPWDVGTFGSRSTPDAGMDLRKAAAALKAGLRQRAAKTWHVAAVQLEVRDGQVHDPAGGRAANFASLVEGLQQISTAPHDVTLAQPDTWSRAGQPTPNLRTHDIVTGQKQFPTDVHLPGMLHGKVLRPPALGASLQHVDASRAQAMAGVTVVQEGGFVGVAASTIQQSEQALALIVAQWQLAPQPAEAQLQDYLRAHPVALSGWEEAVHEETGAVEAAWRAAALRLQATYTTAYIAHVPIETRVALADWQGGRLTVWTGTQRPFGVRSGLAKAFALPEEAVRVLVPDTGTGFGGKQTTETAIEAARLARAAGHPVAVRWTREEEFASAYFRPAALLDVRSAVDADGALSAWEFRNCNAGTAALWTPYAVPNQGIHYQPAASPLPQGPYRSLAAVANNFARESHMDELAHALHLDPVTFRLRHLQDARLAAVLQAVADHALWARRARREGIGLGIAVGSEKGSCVATYVEVRVTQGDIAVLRVVTAFECGALVNPDAVRNQVEGATVMGLGGALFEAIHFDAGRILNPRLSAYRVPRFADLPAIEVILLDRKDLPSAGAGETPIIAVAPAIANAVFDATGRRLRSLPLLPGLG